MPTFSTWAVLTDGVTTFKPVMDRLFDIAQEFIPYFIYIAGGALVIALIWKAVKYIMGYLAGRSKRTVRGK